MQERNTWYNVAFGLAIASILYNILEGLIATYLGYEDKSLALFGFGADSFIEVISGFGIAHMVWRIKKNPDSGRDKFERTALKITGFAFYLLVVGLVFTSLIHLWTNHKPITTKWGVVISMVSILTMWLLVHWKRKAGRQLESAPILADANCTLVCIYMSILLLISSVMYTTLKIPYIDTLGALGLAYFAYKEGKECFTKAYSEKVCCDDTC